MVPDQKTDALHKVKAHSIATTPTKFTLGRDIMSQSLSQKLTVARVSRRGWVVVWCCVRTTLSRLCAAMDYRIGTAFVITTHRSRTLLIVPISMANSSSWLLATLVDNARPVAHH